MPFVSVKCWRSVRYKSLRFHTIKLVMMALQPLQEHLVAVRLVNCAFVSVTLLTGVSSLAEQLLVNNNVRILDVTGNPITVEGARLILQSAVDNGVCQEVLIYHNVFSKLRGDEDYRNDDEVKRMMTTLEQRKIQEVIRDCATYCNTDCNGNRCQD